MQQTLQDLSATNPTMSAIHTFETYFRSASVFCAKRTVAAAQLIAPGMHGQGAEATNIARRLLAQP